VFYSSVVISGMIRHATSPSCLLPAMAGLRPIDLPRFSWPHYLLTSSSPSPFLSASCALFWFLRPQQRTPSPLYSFASALFAVTTGVVWVLLTKILRPYSNFPGSPRLPAAGGFTRRGAFTRRGGTLCPTALPCRRTSPGVHSIRIRQECRQSYVALHVGR